MEKTINNNNISKLVLANKQFENKIGSDITGIRKCRVDFKNSQNVAKKKLK
jgi:hypothetical protein